MVLHAASFPVLFPPMRTGEADVIVIGAGLAGLVATAELVAAGKHVIVLDQEPEQSLGGQAFWSLGGLFLVDSPAVSALLDVGSLDSGLGLPDGGEIEAKSPYLALEWIDSRWALLIRNGANR